MPAFATVDQWSTTPSENNANVGIPMFEGMAPAQVNDSIRTIMAAIRLAYVPPTAFDPSTLAATYALKDLSNVDLVAFAALVAASGVAGSIGFETGDIKATFRDAPSTGWLFCNGLPIGNTGSGASATGPAYQALFELLWATCGNVVLPIQDSGGAPSTRGSTALADWNALKRMPIPDTRGKFIRGWDGGAGLDLGRILGTTQLDAMQGHRHQGVFITGAPGTQVDAASGYSVVSATGDPVTDGANGVPKIAAETRPVNIVCNYMIKL